MRDQQVQLDGKRGDLRRRRPQQAGKRAVEAAENAVEYVIVGALRRRDRSLGGMEASNRPPPILDAALSPFVTSGGDSYP